ncbi:SDR family oxidoreductase [Pseudomonas kielensis]|uniref:SDR family NAD(P)-dependent oxidoreductase n=1 Tax=Pseudomonas kielensis TaxID=2762577 RepID=UPI00223F4277|nr:SDR family oxidoreductase [Pseudomonas kielensis]UZM13956.1 SDR family oxidoreductase [Pseudomonas kielensis]
MDLGLRGKRILIAGASKGIGRSLVETFYAEGCRVAYCARNEALLNQVMQSLNATKDNMLPYALDVQDTATFELMIKQTVSRWGGIDCFIWNISAQSSSWSTGFKVDIESCVNCMDLIIPFLRATQGGSVVAVASRVASIGIPNNKPYAALKAALVHYMASLSQELVGEGIRVNCVSPSEVMSEGSVWARLREDEPEKYQRALKRSPLGRMATPEEIAQAVAFLASPAASYISGVNLQVDAGGHQAVNY